MKDINRVEILGEVTADCNLTYPNDNALCTFEVLTRERFKNREGSISVHTEKHSIECWSALAEKIADYASQGSRLLIEGKIKTKRYTDKKTGQEISRKVILVKQFNPIVYTESEFEYESED